MQGSFVVSAAREEVWLRLRDPDGPFGAKGGGEIGTNVIAAAIANAATAATVRYRRLPLTPEEVLRGMLTKGLA